jgi:hypothetical protein
MRTELKNKILFAFKKKTLRVYLKNKLLDLKDLEDLPTSSLTRWNIYDQMGETIVTLYYE